MYLVRERRWVFLIDRISLCECASCHLPLTYGNMYADFQQGSSKSAVHAFRMTFQFVNSDKTTTIKRPQCSLYLGQEITVNSLPFTCLKSDKYQPALGTEIPNAILWGWNQLNHINLPHVPAPTATVTAHTDFPVQINTGSRTSEE